MIRTAGRGYPLTRRNGRQSFESIRHRQAARDRRDAASGQVRDRKRYSDWNMKRSELAEAGLDDEAWDDLDAIEAVFKKLNAADEAETARRDLCG